MNGENNQYPPEQTDVSSFAAFDVLLSHFTDKTVFPHIKAITLAGHSGGGQVTI
jgi:hypothetical protein